MAGRSFGKDNFIAGSATEQLRASGKNRDQYTSASLPGLGAYASGGVVVADNGYIYHVFLSTGAFTVLQPPAFIDSVEYMVVAGGGAGGSGSSGIGGGGGGGAGGLRIGSVGVGPGPYPVVVGGGGGGIPNDGVTPAIARKGGNSTAFGIVATGGGGGGSQDPGTISTGVTMGADGGSGGGGSGPYPGFAFAGGSGNIPAVFPSQGSNGGEANPGGFGGTPSSTKVAGGGGGYGGRAGNSQNTLSELPAGPPFLPWGAAGPGMNFDSFPVDTIGKAIPVAEYPTWYPVVSVKGFAEGGIGSISDGADSSHSPTNRPNAGRTYCTGYGGHGRTTAVGSNGGSGLVVIRYKMKTAPTARATGGTIEPSTDSNHLGVFRHIFTSSGTFEVTDPTLNQIEYLVVAGGGGGGNSNPRCGGGGGAGGFVSSSNYLPRGEPLTYMTRDPARPAVALGVPKSYPVTASSYPVVIGGGGNGGPTSEPGQGSKGSNSSFGAPGATQVVAYGGGGGGGADTASPYVPYAGAPGGSGGGSAKFTFNPFANSGGASPVPWTPIDGAQGSPGNTSSGPTSFQITAGGGGASGPGGVSNIYPAPTVGGAGGGGWYSLIAPPSYGTPGPVANRRYFAGGGGGTSGGGPGVPLALQGAGPGGAGGGGTGAPFPGATNGTSGLTNTGGGGGGGGGAGGSGIVIIEYPE